MRYAVWNFIEIFFEDCEWPHLTAACPFCLFINARPSVFGEMPILLTHSISIKKIDRIIIMSHYVQFVKFLENVSALHLHLNKELTQIYAILMLNWIENYTGESRTMHNERSPSFDWKSVHWIRTKSTATANVLVFCNNQLLLTRFFSTVKIKLTF